MRATERVFRRRRAEAGAALSLAGGDSATHSRGHVVDLDFVSPQELMLFFAATNFLFLISFPMLFNPFF